MKRTNTGPRSRFGVLPQPSGESNHRRSIAEKISDDDRRRVVLATTTAVRIRAKDLLLFDILDALDERIHYGDW